MRTNYMFRKNLVGIGLTSIDALTFVKWEKDIAIVLTNGAEYKYHKDELINMCDDNIKWYWMYKKHGENEFKITPERMNEKEMLNFLNIKIQTSGYGDTNVSVYPLLSAGFIVS